MAFQSVPNTVEIVLNFLQSGKPAVNVLHAYRSAGYDQAQLDGIAAAMDALVSSNLLPEMTPTQSYVGITVKGLTNSSDLSSSNSDHAGTGAEMAVALPGNVSLCLTLRTGLTGRSARGRIYTLSPHDTDMATPDTVLTVYRDAIVAAYQSLLDRLLLIGWTPVVVSRFHDKVQRPVGVVYPITQLVARNTRVDSQRNRLPLPE